MAERWQLVGEQLGLKIPEHIGKLVLPAFDHEQPGGLTVVATEMGPVVGRLIDHGGENMANRRNLSLILGTATRGWLSVEVHRPHNPPEKSLLGAVTCDTIDVNEYWVSLGFVPRTGAGVGVPSAPEVSPLEEKIRAKHIKQLSQLAQNEGLDVFSPGSANQVADLLNAEFGGHTFDPAMQAALEEQQLIDPAAT